MTDPGSEGPWPEHWRTFGRPGAAVTLRGAANGLIINSTTMIPPEYRDELATIITALGDLADRIEQDHNHEGENQ
jgi:hypothetical protein